MAVPKSRASKSRSRRRKALNMKLQAPGLIECKSCGNLVLPHRVCPKCGSYGGRQVMKLE